MTSLNETKMAISAAMVWMFVCFALLWLRMQRNRRSRRRIVLLEASRRRLAVLHAEQEDLHAILCALFTILPQHTAAKINVDDAQEY